MRDRYWQCDQTCTTDCGACKGAGPPAAPDRPGDQAGERSEPVGLSDQQQAAGVLRKAAEDDEYGRTYVDDFVIDGDAEVVRAAIATALASVRAEEAARWQAKIETLAVEYGLTGDYDVTRSLRGLLDGEQR